MNQRLSSALLSLLLLMVLALVAWSPAGAAERTYQLYFGDLHNHTSFSDGWDGTPEDAYIHARASGADWLATSDHNFMLTQAEWSQTKIFADEQTDSSFVAMAGSEYWVANGFGEVIVLNMEELRNKANFRDPRARLSRAQVIPAFYDWLASHEGAIGHWPHPGLYGDLDRLDHWTEFRDQAMSLIEIHNHGSWVAAPARWAVHDYEDWYILALDKGWHVMPAAVSDTHDVDWISGSPVRTVLLAEELTRDGLFEAMRENRGYATLDENLRIDYTLDGEVMGSVLSSSAGSHTASIHIEDPDGTPVDEITLVEIVSDGGQVIASLPANDTVVDWTTTIPSGAARYFYVRVTTASNVSGGEGVTAWTAPVWTGR